MCVVQGGRRHCWYVLEEKRKAKEEVHVKSIFNNRVGGKYRESIQLYTDGAKRPETEETGFGVAIPGKEVEISKRSSNKLGVYTVELYYSFNCIAKGGKGALILYQSWQV